MKTRGSSKFIMAVIIALSVVAVCSSCNGKKKEHAQEKIAPPAAGYTVTVTEDAQKMDGITTEALKPHLHRISVTAYGRVLDPEGLNSSRKVYIAAVAGLEKAEAALKASEKDYARMKYLNAEGKNISDRDLQAAAARLDADKAEEASARGALQSAKDSIGVKWGPALAEWIFDYSSQLRGVLGTKDVLVQITVPPALPVRGIAEKVRIGPPAGGEVLANFVSRAARSDPRIQGLSFIYVAPSRSGSLLAGMDVTAQMPTGKARTGFLVPLSAVVWLRGKAWVYVKKSQTGFSRVEVSTSIPLSTGYFVSGVFSPGDELVIKGAQGLLSEESKPKAAGGGNEEDED